MIYKKWIVFLSFIVLLVACGDDRELVLETSFDVSVEDVGDVEENYSSSSVNEKSSSSSKGISSAKETASSSSEKMPDSMVNDTVPVVTIENKTIYVFALKGPFRAGTKVKMYELDAETLAQTGEYFEGKFQSDEPGAFVVSGVTQLSPYALFEVTAGDGVTLKAFVDLSDRDTVSVNVLTHLEYERILYLVEKGYSFFAAKTQAEVDVLAAFGIEGSFANFEGLNVAGDNASAELLAISVLALCYGGESKMAEFLNSFAMDIKEDGKWNDGTVKAEIADEAQRKYFEGELSSIYQNIFDFKMGSAPNKVAYERYVNDFWSVIYGFAACRGGKKNFFSSKNSKSSYYGSDTGFVCMDSFWYKQLKTGGTLLCSVEREGAIIDESQWEYTTICKEGKVIRIQKHENSDDGDEYEHEIWNAEDGELRNGEREEVKKFDEILGRWVDANTNDRTLMLNGCTFKRHGEISKSPKDETYYYCDSCPDAVLWYNNGETPYVEPWWRKAKDVDFVRRDEKCEAEDVGRIVDRADSVTGRFYCTVNGWVNLMDWSYDVPKELRFNPDVDYGTMTDDRDGKTYRTVKIGEQIWMAENLNYAGPNDDISRCYEDVSATCEAGGRLYGLAVADTVCPSGWHLPKKEEFETLLATVGGIDNASNALKSISGWTNDYSGSDAYGFSAVPTGEALIESHYGPFFSYSGYNAYFFGDGCVFSINVWNGVDLSKNGGVMKPDEALLSVRCLKDAE